MIDDLLWWTTGGLVDQLFNSSEKRLARVLLLLQHSPSGLAHAAYSSGFANRLDAARDMDNVLF